MATFKNTNPVVGSHPLLGQLFYFGQIGFGDYARLKLGPGLLNEGQKCADCKA